MNILSIAIFFYCKRHAFAKRVKEYNLESIDMDMLCFTGVFMKPCAVYCEPWPKLNMSGLPYINSASSSAEKTCFSKRAYEDMFKTGNVRFSSIVKDSRHASMLRVYKSITAQR